MSRAEREKIGLGVRDVGEFWYFFGKQNLCKKKMHIVISVALVYFLRMEFEDFCHYFTDVVVCRLLERALLWSSYHWKEARLYGEWAPAPAPPGTPPPAVLHMSNSEHGAANQRGNRNEARLRESHQTGGEGGEGGERRAAEKLTEEAEGGEAGGWEAQVHKRSRCGGCINHRKTFLHNPQVKQKWRRFFISVSARVQDVFGFSSSCSG